MIYDETNCQRKTMQVVGGHLHGLAKVLHSVADGSKGLGWHALYPLSKRLILARQKSLAFQLRSAHYETAWIRQTL